MENQLDRIQEDFDLKTIRMIKLLSSMQNKLGTVQKVMIVVLS
jgi:hypothetical protein